MATYAHSIEDARPNDSDNPLAFLPDRYALAVSGHCLEPEISEGDVLTFDRSEPYKPGDLVVVFRRPTDGARFRAEVKRLVFAPPSWVTFPWSDKPDSDIAPLVVLEMNNPPRRFALRCADILGIHKCVGQAAQGAAPAQAPVESIEKEEVR